MFRDVIAETVENGFNVHDKYKTLTVEELRDVCKNESLPFRVCALSVEGDLNIGMLCRSASIFGAEKFYVFGRRKVDKRSFVGAQNYLSVERIGGLNKECNLSLSLFKELVEKDNLLPILVEQGGVDISKITEIISNKIPCLVFGNEASGIPKEFIDEGYICISIPQRGVLRSLNVAAVGAIVVYEWSKKYR